MQALRLQVGKQFINVVLVGIERVGRQSALQFQVAHELLSDLSCCLLMVTHDGTVEKFCRKNSHFPLDYEFSFC